MIAAAATQPPPPMMAKLPIENVDAYATGKPIPTP
jgi:hypothetical protein